MRTYIIAMPDANQTTNSAPPAMPSQRCRRMQNSHRALRRVRRVGRLFRAASQAELKLRPTPNQKRSSAIANPTTAARNVTPEHLPWMGDTSAILPQGWSPPNRRAASGRMCDPHRHGLTATARRRVRPRSSGHPQVAGAAARRPVRLAPPSEVVHRWRSRLPHRRVRRLGAADPHGRGVRPRSGDLPAIRSDVAGRRCSTGSTASPTPVAPRSPR